MKKRKKKKPNPNTDRIASADTLRNNIGRAKPMWFRAGFPDEPSRYQFGGNYGR